MPKNTVLSAALVATQAADLATLLDSGFVDIYDGTQPFDPDTGIGGSTLLVSCAITSSTPSGNMVILTVADGIAVAGAPTTATWFRAYQSDHTTGVLDGSVGTTDENLIKAGSADITLGETVTIDSWQHAVLQSFAGE